MSNADATHDDIPPRAWHDYENGRTLGRRGPEGGTVLRDEELGEDAAASSAGNDEDEEGPVADARLTLERVGDNAFALTATLYGWMAHTHLLAADDTDAALQAFDTMKAELARLARLLPYEDDRDIDKKVRALNAAIDEFTRRFA